MIISAVYAGSIGLTSFTGDDYNTITSAVPSGAVVYHKYGQLWGNLYDTAIIEYRGRHLVLVVYTKSSTADASYNSQQVRLITQIATAVTENMSNL